MTDAAFTPQPFGGSQSRAGDVQFQPRRLAWPGRLALSIAATDTFVIVLALLVAQLARFGWGDVPKAPGDTFALRYSTLAPVIGVLWLFSLWAARSRERRIIGIGAAEYRRVANATLITFGALAIFAYLAQLDVARGYLAIALPTGLLLLLLDRLLWRRALARMRRAGRCLTGAIVVGPAIDVDRVISQLSANLRAGYRPIAVCVTDEASDLLRPSARELPAIGMTELVETSKRTRTRAVMVAGSLPGGNAQIRDIGWALENSKVELILVSRLTDVAGPRIHLRPVEGLPLVHVDLPQYNGLNHSVKRLLDIVLAGIAVIALSPILIFAAIAVRLGDGGEGGPVLFRQERVGARGTRFTMYKFRSMVVDAEARLAELTARSDGNGTLFKMRDDPRVTAVGRVMRRYSIDELPQLFNVLRGDMSLVGPRPPLPSEVQTYEGQVTRRLLTKPGITGLWQVSGRSNLSWEDSVKLDLYYVENWSVMGDFMILVRTLRAVLRREGAY